MMTIILFLTTGNCEVSSSLAKAGMHFFAKLKSSRHNLPSATNAKALTAGVVRTDEVTLSLAKDALLTSDGSHIGDVNA
jgi:hypothetical protein